MDDDRLAYLIQHLQEKKARGPQAFGGFSHCTVWEGELLDALEDLQRLRERPLHCPGCDGDHL